jgi:hypothetical protein
MRAFSLLLLLLLGACQTAAQVTPTCGKNTQLDATTRQCVVARAACQGGTTLDPESGACQSGNNGTLIHSSTFAMEFGSLFHMGAAGLEPIGATGVINAGIGDGEPTYLASGIPTGAIDPAPVHWTPGAVSSTPSAIDHPLTVGEWRSCGGSWSIYKDPPKSAKRYRMVVELAGCPPSTLYTLWLVYGRGPTRADRILGAPLGGLPQVIVVDADGEGHFSRDLDPQVWFQPGAIVGGINVADESSGTAAVLDPAQVPAAAIWIDLDFQNSGQSNGNAGFCEIDVSGHCVTPASPNLFLPGQLSISTAPMLTSEQIADAQPLPLAMAQPY